MPVITLDEIMEIEKMVNNQIQQNREVSVYVRLDENSTAYKILNYCLILQSSIKTLNTILSGVNAILLFTLFL
jgi:hypothetical protein